VFLPATVLYIISLVCIAIIMIVAITNIDLNNHTTEGDI
jgi:hypothetical protein